MRNPLSLEAFADWLGTMPADGEYDYCDPVGCAICQYLDFLGIKYRSVCGIGWWDADGKVHPLPRWNRACNYAGDETFGGAHKRARAILAGQYA